MKPLEKTQTRYSFSIFPNKMLLHVWIAPDSDRLPVPHLFVGTARPTPEGADFPYNVRGSKRVFDGFRIHRTA